MMTAADFTAWCEHMREARGWSARECTRRLGCGHNQVGRWKAHGAPPYIALACNALASAIGPWAASRAAGQ